MLFYIRDLNIRGFGCLQGVLTNPPVYLKGNCIFNIQYCALFIFRVISLGTWQYTEALQNITSGAFRPGFSQPQHYRHTGWSGGIGMGVVVLCNGRCLTASLASGWGEHHRHPRDNNQSCLQTQMAPQEAKLPPAPLPSNWEPVISSWTYKCPEPNGKELREIMFF